MKCSIVLSTRNKAMELDLSLASIRRQNPRSGYYEVVVVDDGSTDHTKAICSQYDVDQYVHLKNNRYRNPSKARNVGYRLAKGEVIIAQSDDIVHRTMESVRLLTEGLDIQGFLLAQVDNWEYRYGEPRKFIRQYSGSQWKKPYFFLGSLWREDLYAIGGCDEDFVEPCWDDNWFADCLMFGLDLKPQWATKVKAHHVSHKHYHQLPTAGDRSYGPATHKGEKDSEQVYKRKVKAAVFCSSGGPWNMDGTNQEEPAPPKVVSKVVSVEPRRDLKADGKIPRKMSCFWAGDRMSWMRYMSLYSFKRFHPDWDITLYRPVGKLGGKAWTSSEAQDTEVYHGPCYLDQLSTLNITLQEWQLPQEDLAPSHACDLCQWEVLSTEGGWYSDLDILWVDSLPYEGTKDVDAVFCLTGGFMAIGLVASAPDSPLFRDVLEIAQKNYAPNKYQSTGAEAIYRMAGVWPHWGSYNQPGQLALNYLRQTRVGLSITDLPPQTVYPWDYTRVSKIFVEDKTLPKGCKGIHWFGGNNLAQEWNGRLTHENFISCGPNTYTRYAERITQ